MLNNVNCILYASDFGPDSRKGFRMAVTLAHSNDAKLNGLAFDRHEEEVAVETFSSALRAAGLDFVRDPMGAPQIPNWSRVVSAMPDFLDDLREAVDEDAREAH